MLPFLLDNESSFASAGPIPQCPLQYFFDFLLPDLGDATSVLSRIKGRIDIDSALTAICAPLEREELTISKNHIFDRLCTVFNDVNRTFHEKRPGNMILDMVDVPNRTPFMGGPKAAHETRPGSYLGLRQVNVTSPNEDGVAWGIIVVPWEYKERDGEGDLKHVSKPIFGRTLLDEHMDILECQQGLVDHGSNTGSGSMPSFYLWSYSRKHGDAYLVLRPQRIHGVRSYSIFQLCTSFPALMALNG
jgi:hypothetical protein